MFLWYTSKSSLSPSNDLFLALPYILTLLQPQNDIRSGYHQINQDHNCLYVFPFKKIHFLAFDHFLSVSMSSHSSIPNIFNESLTLFVTRKLYQTFVKLPYQDSNAGLLGLSCQTFSSSPPSILILSSHNCLSYLVHP